MNLPSLVLALALASTQGSGQATPPDPALFNEIRAAVARLRPQLALRPGPVSVARIVANGAEIVYDMEVPNDLDAAAFARFREQLPIQACANPQAVALFRRGGSYTYHLKDSTGETVTASVSRC